MTSWSSPLLAGESAYLHFEMIAQVRNNFGDWLGWTQARFGDPLSAAGDRRHQHHQQRRAATGQCGRTGFAGLGGPGPGGSRRYSLSSSRNCQLV
jgi:hypothetical protein